MRLIACSPVFCLVCLFLFCFYSVLRLLFSWRGYYLCKSSPLILGLMFNLLIVELPCLTSLMARNLLLCYIGLVLGVLCDSYMNE